MTTSSQTSRGLERRNCLYGDARNEHQHFIDDQLAAFARDGFVVVRGLNDSAAMAEVTAWIDDMQGWPENA
ncbi:MAG: hypothetical protein VYA71_03645 [Pseudomonadota bacterium]|nr:hypothetical protein [Pseudomonadota bacterium]